MDKMDKTTTNNEYLANQAEWLKHSGLKKGDRCVVIDKCASQASDWTGDWVSEMDALIGKEGVVIECGKNVVDGIFLEFPDTSVWAFPFFLLAKAENDK